MFGAIFSSFLVPFLIGFTLINGTFSKHRHQHLNNEILFLNSLLWGFGFVFAIYIIWPHFDRHLPVSKTEYWAILKDFLSITFENEENRTVKTSLPDYLIASIITTCFTLIAHRIVKHFFPAVQEHYSIRATYELGDRLERLVYRARETNVPIMVTLNNRKVYVGFVQGLQEYSPRNPRRYLILLPIESGVRNSDDLSYRPVEDYRFLTIFLMDFYEAYQKVKTANSIKIAKGTKTATLSPNTVKLIAEYPMLINMDEIITVTPWVQEIYEMFANGRKGATKKASSKKSHGSKEGS